MGQLQQLIEETIAALTTLDAQALERIQPELQGLAAVPFASADVKAIMPSHRLLGALLLETERNLRLFRAVWLSARQAADTGCYTVPLR